MATYYGNKNNNIYNGTSYSDDIYGYGGNDKLNGLAGDDQIYAGDGNDTLNGGAGRDVLQGESGMDTYLIAKNDGVDYIDNFDTDGSIDVVKFTDLVSTDITKISRLNDTLSLDYGDNSDLTVKNQFLSPDYRIDQFQFSDGVIWSWTDVQQITKDDDTLYGTDGQHNTLSGFAGNDWLFGGNLADTLNGGQGDDYLESYDGNDLLIGGRGNDILQGGTGGDTYLIGKNDGKDIITNNEWKEAGSINTVKFTDVNLIGLTAINLVDGKLVINYGNNSQLTLPTNAIDKFLFADGAVLTNFVIGTADNDVLAGTTANDAVVGLQGADSMAGGAGKDLYLVDNSADTITEAANAGRDTVLSSVDFTLTANVENLALLAGALTATGNNLNNVLTGNSSNNILFGLLGSDILNGGIGADTLNGGNGSDTLTGGLGKDLLILTESAPATDTVKIAAGDSKTTAYDRVVDFALGNGATTTGADKLDLGSSVIASDVAAADGINAGIIQSHAISNGIISFDDADSYTAALTLTAANLSDVFAYLQDNITANATVAFNALGNTYVFQDGGATDTLVQLSGITASNLNNTGLVAGGVWLV